MCFFLLFFKLFHSNDLLYFTMRLLLVVLAAALFVSCHSSGLTVDGQGKRVLALLDNYGMRESHSTFFKSLKDRGFQVTFKAADDADLTIAKYGEYLFDHIALFCPNVVGMLIRTRICKHVDVFFQLLNILTYCYDSKCRVWRQRVEQGDRGLHRRWRQRARGHQRSNRYHRN